MLASTTLNLASFGSQLLNSPSHNPTKPFLLPPNQPFLKSPNPISSSSSSFLKSRTTSVRTAVASVDSSDAAVKREQEGGEGGSKSYHFVVANAKFMLDEEEHFQELMGERLRLYGERNMEQDFWLMIEPKFLDKFPTITKRLNRPVVALVSINGPWITTVTAPVDLLKCLKSIKDHAFSASPYPVIITLEDHINRDLQAKVAQMLSQVFGKMLFYPESECLKEFPSPEELKHRIIISTKPPKEYLEAQNLKGSESSNALKRKDSDDDVWGVEPSILTADHEDEDKIDNESTDLNPNNDDDDECDFGGRQAPEYRRLIAIHAGKPKGGMKESLKVDPDKVRRLSVSEQALEKAAESHGIDIVRFTQKNFLRVYPKGTRFNSSNYKPQVGWLHGAQMIAFNMQGYGRSLWLMQGMFRANGGCGFVKKPDILMNSNMVFDPKAKSPVNKTLKVKVYMGDGWHMDFKQTHFDSYSPPDFYVRVGIAGAPADEIMKKTKTIEDNWSPVWEEEFTFPLTVPELALLRIEVHEYDMSEKDDFVGQTCLPFSELRSGIRAIALCDRKGEKLNSARLLMRFDIS